MADLYVWSGTGGTPTAPYAAWDTAAVNLQTAVTAAAAGDTIYVAHDHNESGAGVNCSFTGTQNAPTKVLCGTRSGTTGTGISGLATTAQVHSTNSTFSLSGGAAYVYGIHFHADLTGSGTPMNLGTGATSNITFESCNFYQNNSSPSSVFLVGSTGAITNAALVCMRNCGIKGQAAAHNFNVSGYFEVRGLTFISGTTSPSPVFVVSSSNRGAVIDASGIDASNLSTTFNLCGPGGNVGKARLRNVKLPASWVGNVVSSVPSSGINSYELWNYTIGTEDKNYRFWTSNSFGHCKEDATVYRTSGAADETPTHYSIKMTSTANVSYPHLPLRSPPIIVRLPSVGSSKTITVQIAYDGATALTDKQVWLEMEYLGNSGFALASYGSDQALPTASPTNQTSSSEAWTGATGTGPNGSSTWNKQSLDITFTPQEIGYAVVWVCLGKDNTAMTIYSDWKATVA